MMKIELFGTNVLFVAVKAFTLNLALYINNYKIENDEFFMVAVSGIVNYNGKILIGKKRKDSAKFLAGQWHIPGETIENNETDENALKRCFREEANLEIIVGDYICSSESPGSKSEVRWYHCYSNTAEVKPNSDLEEIKWVIHKDVIKFCSKKAINLWPDKIKYFFTY